MTTRLAPLIAFAACGSPPLQIKLEIAGGPAQTCPQTTCSGITMSCDPWVSIRVLDPHDPTAPFVSVCKEVLLDSKSDLCSLGSVDLPSGASIPEITLEVQVIVYPRSQLTTDPMTGDVVCPTDIQFDDATGAPVYVVSPGVPTGQPAIGGHAYYHAGDSVTVVPLGCSDLTELDDPTCTGNAQIPIQATVDDFGTRLSVTKDVGAMLTVSAGEPQPELVGNQTVYKLDLQDVRGLDPTGDDPPAWSADVNLTLVHYACVEVLEQGAQQTPTVSCVPAPSDPTTGIQLLGERVTKPQLDMMLAALGIAFPSKGLVVGIVIDDGGNPVSGVTVNATGAHVLYLNAAMTGVVTTSTSATGIFFSLDAPFGTTFSSAASPTNIAPPVIGGLVEDKVTVVVLQLPSAVGS
jgi:hypothetical protein